MVLLVLTFSNRSDERYFLGPAAAASVSSTLHQWAIIFLLARLPFLAFGNDVVDIDGCRL